MSMAVHLDRPPHSVFLAVWGRHDTGWWACVTFQARVATPVDTPRGSGAGGGGAGAGAGAGAVPELAVAAWVPAHAVTKPAWAAATGVGRIVLPVDRLQWPAPPRWPAWYAGVWTDGPLPLPVGVHLVTGAAWRNRPPRAP